MRLHSLRIGGPGDAPSDRFKNLKDLTIDFSQRHWITVLIGWNGAGKSNVLEALAIIFGELVSSKEPKIDFAFSLTYSLGKERTRRLVRVDNDPTRSTRRLVMRGLEVGRDAADEAEEENQYADLVEAKIIPLKRLHEPLKPEDPDRGFKWLPRRVFGYYSGESPRLREVFQEYLKDHDQALRSNRYPGRKKLFFALPEHSRFVLLAFLLSDDPAVEELLREEVGIHLDDGLESVLFVVREPHWSSKDGDPRFWNARGVVAEFLSELYDASLAPVRFKRRTQETLWNERSAEFIYLYLTDREALKRLAGRRKPAEFFAHLESTQVSDLLDNVYIRVRLRNADGAITFRELSEGEQQLLTVLGLMLFTRDEETLFLLDEPDTHLNPKWSVDYLDFVRRFMGKEDEGAGRSHALITTHNPIAIAELERDQVQIMNALPHDRAVRAVHPKEDPRGMGYAAIVTSDMFGISSSLDRSTEEKLAKQRQLAGKEKLSAWEQHELNTINDELDRLGFRFSLPDSEYSAYLKARYRRLNELYPELSEEDREAQMTKMPPAEKEKLALDIIRELDQEGD